MSYYDGDGVHQPEVESVSQTAPYQYVVFTILILALGVTLFFFGYGLAPGGASPQAIVEFADADLDAQECVFYITVARTNRALAGSELTALEGTMHSRGYDRVDVRNINVDDRSYAYIEAVGC